MTTNNGLAEFLRARLAEERAELELYLQNPLEGLSDDALHQRHAHPAYEYKTTEGQRKAWPYVDDPPPGDGWELNRTSFDPDAFQRLDYTEERYWRRLDPSGLNEWSPPMGYMLQLAKIDATLAVLNAHARDHECLSLTGSGDHSVVDGKPWQLWELEHTANAGRPCFVLRCFALPYAGHPDYREEWGS